ncbi:hypothetical protein BDV23DRAFT_169606 [Aspergillus alliaceus]|uniref:Methyltransferase type 11 domain-containing protein n=1 Tax=Petromyces alliaceus TaxID=209559 RepID=A0A5N7CJ79_PETAA|nr:hypothetical protein BDV23DRAFT_169606 [Aspergillus alliaceus]
MSSSSAYDDSEIFRSYYDLPRNERGLDAVTEWPLMKWANENGARRVHGIDVSVNMLAKANELNSGECITYEQVDLNTIVLPANSYDIIYSSLVFHHTKDGEWFWPVRTYGQEGPRVLEWIADGIPSYHRTIQTYVSAVLENAFELTDLAEWMMPPVSIFPHQDSGRNNHRPVRLIICAKKK